MMEVPLASAERGIKRDQDGVHTYFLLVSKPMYVEPSPEEVYEVNEKSHG